MNRAFKNRVKGESTINQGTNKTNNKFVRRLPPSHLNAIELAQVQLDQLKNKELVLEQIKQLIDSE
jgi:hypothetical protein